MFSLKQYLIALILVGFTSLGISQTVFHNPKFKTTKSPDAKIVKIELTEDYTILHFTYTITDWGYRYGGWISVLNSIYLRDVKTKKKYYLRKAENIPYYPEKYQFKKEVKQLEFSLFFQPLDSTTTVVNLFENIEGGFKIFRIQLSPDEKE